MAMARALGLWAEKPRLMGREGSGYRVWDVGYRVTGYWVVGIGYRVVGIFNSFQHARRQNGSADILEHRIFWHFDVFGIGH